MSRESPPMPSMICLRDLPNYREASMPGSPENKTGVVPAPISPATSLTPVSTIARPLSTSSSVSVPAMNGAHSPHSSLNGRTPSPPSLSGSMASQQLPPACGARQLSKLKRFLTTLQQFGADISPEIGERVRGLVLALVNNHLSIEEFHAKLQEATNFPLRPFVIPFLKANLPLLQRELFHCARLAKQSPQHYLAHNEHILFDPTHSPLEPHDLSIHDMNENGKHKSPDGFQPYKPHENGVDPRLELNKRHHAHHPQTSPGVGGNRVSPNAAQPPFAPVHTGGSMRLEDMSMSREIRERVRADREHMERERDRHHNSYAYQRGEHYEPHLERLDDEWKHVENMLHCVISMVDKTKRALAVLQERSQRDREELSVWMRRNATDGMGESKKRPAEYSVDSLRGEDRDIKRRAEEAVNEVKRQAVAELQKAVQAAEAKAAELVAAERAKMDRALTDARKQAREEVLSQMSSQEESSESCWNCGRKASETCSGCNIARYCGSFCQHKDWENHHHVCGQTAAGGKPTDSQPAVSKPAPTIPSVTATVSTSANVTSVGQDSNTTSNNNNNGSTNSTAERDVSSPTLSVASTPKSASRSSSPDDKTAVAATTTPATTECAR